MNSLRTFISPVCCMSLLAGPMLQAGTFGGGHAGRTCYQRRSFAAARCNG